MNVTIPVGAQVAGDVVVTCAHKVTGWPHTGELGKKLTVVVEAP
ncbi:hypothetical protein [Streptomyces yatensis]|nr:hypothetical protein [Streptomyces yatensis]